MRKRLFKQGLKLDSSILKFSFKLYEPNVVHKQPQLQCRAVWIQQLSYILWLSAHWCGTCSVMCDQLVVHDSLVKCHTCFDVSVLIRSWTDTTVSICNYQCDLLFVRHFGFKAPVLDFRFCFSHPKRVKPFFPIPLEERDRVPNPTVIVTGSRSRIPRRKKNGAPSVSVWVITSSIHVCVVTLFRFCKHAYRWSNEQQVDASSCERLKLAAPRR